MFVYLLEFLLCNLIEKLHNILRSSTSCCREYLITLWAAKRRNVTKYTTWREHIWIDNDNLFCHSKLCMCSFWCLFSEVLSVIFVFITRVEKLKWRHCTVDLKCQYLIKSRTTRYLWNKDYSCPCVSVQMCGDRPITLTDYFILEGSKNAPKQPVQANLQSFNRLNQSL